MKVAVSLPAALALLAASAASPASAQFYAGPVFGDPFLGGPVFVPRRAIAPLPPGAIYAELADRGYEPVGILRRTERVYVVDAYAPSGRPVRLIVDAFSGDLLENYAREGAPAERERIYSTRPPERKLPGARPAPARTAEVPLPPRSSAVSPAPAAVAAPAPRPAPSASDWAPINAVPVAPLD